MQSKLFWFSTISLPYNDAKHLTADKCIIVYWYFYWQLAVRHEPVWYGISRHSRFLSATASSQHKLKRLCFITNLQIQRDINTRLTISTRARGNAGPERKCLGNTSQSPYYLAVMFASLTLSRHHGLMAGIVYFGLHCYYCLPVLIVNLLPRLSIASPHSRLATH